MIYCVFGLSAGMTSVDSLSVFLNGQDLAFIGAFIYSVALVIGGLIFQSQKLTNVLRKGYLLFFIVGLLIFIVLPSDFLFLGESFLLIGFIIVDNLVWLLQPSVKTRSNKDSFSVFGKGRLICYGALFIGFAAGYCLAQLPDFLSSNLFLFICAVLLIVVVVAQNIVLSERTMFDLMEARKSLSDELPSIEDRCKELAPLAGISSRELEVMILLAKGMSYSHIEKELFISRNTVKSHANHIYRKTGVTSRQELLDIIYAPEADASFFS
jgi:DNA-binding CsgD family transcriptional regulator